MLFSVSKIVGFLTLHKRFGLTELLPKKLRVGKYFSLKDWLIRDWDKPFGIVDENAVNLGEMLKVKGVK